MINIHPGKIVHDAKTYIQRKKDSKVLDKISDFSRGYELGKQPKDRIKETITTDMFTSSKKSGVIVRSKSFFEGLRTALKNKK